MSADTVTYLSGESNSPLYSRLLDHLRQSKQGRASAQQWLATLRALTQKGVKGIELEESGALTWLAQQPAAQVIDRQTLIEEIGRRYYTVKEVVLGEPRYPQYRQPGGTYREYLYIANSERANVEDEIERVEFAMEQLCYDPSPILENPGIVASLEGQLAALRANVETSIDFPNHHFSQQVNGKHGKNLLAHVRVTVRGDVYFIEEIQSDWAQRGRQSKWIGIPRGPLVTSTDAWAGMVVRRHMQIAARMPLIKRVAWITESMRNGGPQKRDEEQAKHEQARAYASFVQEHIANRLQALGADAMAPQARQVAQEMAASEAARAAAAKGLSLPEDSLNEFYVALLPKLAQKVLGKTSTLGMAQIRLGGEIKSGSYLSPAIKGENIVTVPSFEMTDQARELLAQPQPLYSLASLRRETSDEEDLRIAVQRALAASAQMTGSVQHVKFSRHVYDVASGREVAGKYLNGLAHISLKADNLEEVADHELFHFAHERLFTDAERSLIQREFSADSVLTHQTRNLLARRGMPEAAAQCTQPLEAAAHAFSMWRQGHMSVHRATNVESVFVHIGDALRDGLKWLRKTVLQEQATTVEELFEAFARGELAERARQQTAHRAGLQSMTPSQDDTLTTTPRMRA